MKDKFSAVWVSHSSMGDFLKCPRAYYLKNVYKDPKTRRKMAIATPALSLGSAVHTVLEGLAEFPAKERMNRDLFVLYEKAWKSFTGRKGGFCSDAEEIEYKDRGKKMIQRAIDNPSIFMTKIIRLNDELPHFYLSEEDNIILCGKIDWLQYLEQTDSVHVIDFKTGKRQEDEESLQLPIYKLLLNECQKRPVSKASYWYLETDDALTEKTLPSLATAKEKVLEVALQVKAVRESEEYTCPRGEQGCFACRDFEKVLRGEAEYVGVGEYNQDIYVMPCSQ